MTSAITVNPNTKRSPSPDSTSERGIAKRSPGRTKPAFESPKQKRDTKG